MDANFVKERITHLRLLKGVSEYKMSYDLGHSRGYVNNISSGKTLPSMAEFFVICEYFGITPLDFFNESEANPGGRTQLLQAVSKLPDRDQAIVMTLVRRLQEK